MESSHEYIEIAGRRIGPGESSFIVAEVGSNHDGDLDTALRYINEAAEIGVDAVKFQTIDPDKFLADRVVVNGELVPNEAKAKAKFIPVPADWYPKLFSHAKERGILAFSAPFDLDAVDMLVAAGTPALKIASCDVTNYALLEKVAGTDKPILFSTGMSTLEEVRAALRVLDQNGAAQVVLLHCVSTYPTEFNEVNLRALTTMYNEFRRPVGLSDHTPGWATAVGGVAMGACVVEKHITFGRDLPGTDHFFAIEVPEFRGLVRAIRDLEAALGTGVKAPSEGELDRMVRIRRGLYAARPIAEGELIGPDDIIAMRPQNDYIRANEILRILGLAAPRSFERGEPLCRGDFPSST